MGVCVIAVKCGLPGRLRRRKGVKDKRTCTKLYIHVHTCHVQIQPEKSRCYGLDHCCSVEGHNSKTCIKRLLFHRWPRSIATFKLPDIQRTLCTIKKVSAILLLLLLRFHVHIITVLSSVFVALLLTYDCHVIVGNR